MLDLYDLLQWFLGYKMNNHAQLAIVICGIKDIIKQGLKLLNF